MPNFLFFSHLHNKIFENLVYATVHGWLVDQEDLVAGLSAFMQMVRSNCSVRRLLPVKQAFENYFRKKLNPN